MYPRFFFLFLLLFSFLAGQTQAKPGKFISYGAFLGFADDASDKVDYKVYFAGVDWSKSFRIPHKKDFLAWYAQPQFNLVKASTTPENSFDIEFGLNLGLRNYIRINENLYLYQMLGSGPHYISAKLDRQASGFIFSDNLAIGSFIRTGKHRFLNALFGIRHISNANLELPNKGVNAWFLMLGFSGIK